MQSDWYVGLRTFGIFFTVLLVSVLVYFNGIWFNPDLQILCLFPNPTRCLARQDPSSYEAHGDLPDVICKSKANNIRWQAISSIMMQNWLWDSQTTDKKVSFFPCNCYLAASCPTLGHCRVSRLANLMWLPGFTYIIVYLYIYC